MDGVVVEAPDGPAAGADTEPPASPRQRARERAGWAIIGCAALALVATASPAPLVISFFCLWAIATIALVAVAKDGHGTFEPRLDGLGRSAIAATVFVGVLAPLLLAALSAPPGRDGGPALALATWWLGFPFLAGPWARSAWWPPVAWLSPLLLDSIDSGFMGEQAAAFLAMGALVTAALGLAAGGAARAAWRWLRR